MVNSAEVPVTATFSGLATGKREDLFAGETAATTDGAFSITVPSLAVKAFQFLTNRPPGFGFTPLRKHGAIPGLAYGNSIAGDAADPDLGDTLSFSKSVGPAWLAVASDGALSGTPSASDEGSNTFTVRGADAGGLFAEAPPQHERPAGRTGPAASLKPGDGTGPGR